MRSGNRLTRIGGIAAAFLIAGLAGPALADEDHPCLTDAERLCADVEPGDGRLGACLEENREEVSLACRVRVKAMHKEMDEKREACNDDAIRLCDGVAPGKGRVLGCLVDAEAELSEECRAELVESVERAESVAARLRAKGERIQKLCQNDIVEHCADVEPGNARVLRCLHDHEADLAEECAEAL